MTVLLRILIVLCSLTTAAHFLRFGTLWDAAPALLALPAAFFPRFLPRPLLALGLLGSALLWAEHGTELATLRMNFGLPWMRLALILGAVCLAHLGATALLLTGPGKKLFGPLSGVQVVKTATALMVGGVLLMAVDKTPFPLLLGDRFFPGSEIFWICLFAIYGAMVSGWLLADSRGKVRSRIWTLFSAVFFGQLLLGLAGFSIFLMTGKLHLPVPALILAGPLYRGEGFFMPILLGVSLLLTGPAWCSYLCYIGAWDDRLARLAARPPAPLPAWAPRVRPGLSCSLCGDCLPRCPHGHLGYSFPGLPRERARQVFVTLVASLHAVFLAVARI